MKSHQILTATQQDDGYYEREAQYCAGLRPTGGKLPNPPADQSPGDRELLEMAAKAAGIEITWENSHPYPERLEDFRGLSNYFPWNPLADDGDALRLAVALDLCVLRFGNMTTAKVCTGFDSFDERDNGNPCAATRRAIVRAAASIGAAK